MLSLSPTVFAQIDERIRIAGRGLSCNAQAASLIVLCLLAFFTHLGAFEVDLMEARNFVTAREMVNDHHWLVPTMNGELRITKPPLPT
jgi:4-amino-4-deoxy-L-arabinose transferase-like glycosyltransferase